MLHLYPLFITLSIRASDHKIIGISFKLGEDSQPSVMVLITTKLSLLLQIIGVAMHCPLPTRMQ
jgi:hypothetical protein